MIAIRKARPEEGSFIQELEESLDLVVPPSFSLTSEIWVVEDEGKLIAMARLTDLGKGYFLSSVGVVPEKRGQGLAGKLLQALLAGREKDVYLYTIIPAFFSRLGFEPTSPPRFLPSRDLFSCRRCQPEDCRCLVRRARVPEELCRENERKSQCP